MVNCVVLTKTCDVSPISLALCRLVGLHKLPPHDHLAVIYKIVITRMFAPDVLLKSKHSCTLESRVIHPPADNLLGYIYDRVIPPHYGNKHGF